MPYSYVVSTLANNGVGIGIPVPLSITLRSDGCTDPLVRQVNGGLVGGHDLHPAVLPDANPAEQGAPAKAASSSRTAGRWTG